ncbi:diversity-generating retroelement protein Avd [Nodosilinea sp. FACHB-131]|uniref:diversity-generating retroelement protein Avd n=1 Tax=Cyanophyceae TaxID=3028117 RepID=UPI0016877CA1|nr:diversity-generating retroelement protein Avd [Nodosilinea sp. FACHB-131]MBD1877177.1 diversity-generating retroelement protein Avd [Nodosilinea sp. FACHB-131]
MKRDLPIVQKTYDLVKWYVPVLNKLPRDHKFLLGDRIITGLYDLLEGLILARYSSDKLPRLKALNGRLDLLRHQTRLLFEFELMSAERYQYISQLIDGIGQELGGWMRQQQQKTAANA